MFEIPCAAALTEGLGWSSRVWISRQGREAEEDRPGNLLETGDNSTEVTGERLIFDQDSVSSNSSLSAQDQALIGLDRQDLLWDSDQSAGLLLGLDSLTE